jgi:hypothetical protein
MKAPSLMVFAGMPVKVDESPCGVIYHEDFWRSWRG